MGAFRKFLICLAPAILAYILILAGKDRMLGLAVILIAIGGVIAGSCVTVKLHRSMDPQNEATVLKGFLGILTFVGVLVGYFSLGMAGCCGIAMLSESFR